MVADDGEGRAFGSGFRRPFRGRSASHQRRQFLVPSAHDLEDEDLQAREAPAWRLCSTGRRCSPEVRVRASRRSAAGSSRTTCSKRLLPCPTSSSTTPGSPTYFWVVTNRKSPRRRGKIQLLDAREIFTKTRKSLGQKRKELSVAQIDEIARLYGSFEEGPLVKIFPNEEFGFLRITVERPLQLRWEITDDTLLAVESLKAVGKLDSSLRDALLDALRERLGSSFATEKLAKAVISEALDSAGLGKTTALVNAVTGAIAVQDPEAPIITDRSGNPKPDPDLRDYENILLPAVSVTFEDDPTARLETIEYRTAIDDYMENRGAPLRPRRLARPRQDEDRL